MVKIILLIRHQYSVVFEYVDVSEVIFSEICCLFEQVLYLGKGVFFWGIAAKNFYRCWTWGKGWGQGKGIFFWGITTNIFTGAALQKGLRSRKGGIFWGIAVKFLQMLCLAKTLGWGKGEGEWVRSIVFMLSI